MKKLIFLTAITALIATTNAATAQVRVNVNLNVGRPPVVYNQPVYYNDNLGWNGMEDYYYLQDAGVYYNVSRRMYFYPNGSQWMMASCLPARYNGYTWNMGRRVRYNGRPDFVRGGGYRNNVAYGRGYNNGYNNGNRGYAYNNGGYAQRGAGYGNRGGGYDNRGGGYENHGGNGNGNRGGGNYGGGNDNRGGGYENHGGGGNGNHGGGGSYGGGNHGGGHGH